jgi:polysaccharide biosynthesis/export protein
MSLMRFSNLLAVLSLAVSSSWAVAAEQPYTIQAGDVLELRVVGAPELSQKATVSLDGMVAFPLVEDIVAAGRTLGEVRAQLRATLSQVQAPRENGRGFEDMVAFAPSQIGLSIAEYRPIYLSGTIANTGAHPYRIGMTVREALALAGGMPALQPEAMLTAQAEYASAMGELAREQLRLQSLLAEQDGKSSFQPTDSNNTAPVSRALELVSLEAKRFASRKDALAAEKAFLVQYIGATERRLEVLHRRRDQEAASLDADEADFDSVNKLFKQGLAVAGRLADARRNVLFSSTRVLQTESKIAQAESEKNELQRRIARLDESRRENLLEELRQAESKVQDLQTRTLYLAQKIALSSAQSEGRQGFEKARLSVYRRTKEGVESIEADPNTSLLPGDVVEVNLPNVAGTIQRIVSQGRSPRS